MKSLPLRGKDLGKKADLIDESAFLPFGDLSSETSINRAFCPLSMG
jgi:hypothetical protein